LKLQVEARNARGGRRAPGQQRAMPGRQEGFVKRSKNICKKSTK
jgi:hypothetical protein